MDKTEYEEFVGYIYHEHIENRLARIRSRIMRHRLDDELQHHIDELSKAIRAIRLIREYAEDDETINRSFTPEMLDRTLSRVEQGTRFNNRIIVETEIVDIIQDYFGEIVEGMKVDHFPKEDFEILRQSGSVDPHREVVAMIHLVRSRKERFIQESRNVRFSQRLKQTLEHIEEIRKALPKESHPKQNEPGIKNNVVKRATLKGIGSIAQGAMLTITDLTLAAGWWNVSLPIETTTVGAVVSATTGVGMILSGVGELRGE
ncbi:MAG: hypothetical protein V9G20_23920 [Candidatus Promineifilaceae bacterium]|nr:hypothetical protein [Chloroflexota bacterium]